ncbi:hypothetical protein PGTUg99_034862 [Puccinia graminis f. sp. tritici]|uniref:Uncharacterized protein n=1 Tax=Puccinia graminis f. sp. tritici TaxID=56615 RepID=A0A5B0SA01_PUCGR|nr:hypothetical protein PGTUg99_014527 [Puccinia graminis f. sp. tritici]KAA1134299.1 hypothetical protein PGTUg99_034862 [Puccinia graminis f. sp. tritici]
MGCWSGLSFPLCQQGDEDKGKLGDLKGGARVVQDPSSQPGVSERSMYKPGVGLVGVWNADAGVSWSL